MTYHITNSELAILQVMWRENRPLSRGEILELSCDEKSWHSNSIHILLNAMLKKGTIEAVDFVRSGKVWARTYSPTITAMDYYTDFCETNGWPDPVEYVKFVLSREDCDIDVVDAMIDVINKRRQTM